MAATTSQSGFTREWTSWGGFDPSTKDDGVAWTWNGTSEVLNKDVSMLKYTNNTDKEQIIISVYLFLGTGRGEFTYDGNTHIANNRNYSTYMIAKNDSETILGTSQTIEITETVYRNTSTGYYYTDSALTNRDFTSYIRTFTFPTPIRVASGETITFYNHYIMEDYTTVIAIHSTTIDTVYGDGERPGTFGGTIDDYIPAQMYIYHNGEWHKAKKYVYHDPTV